MNPWSMVLDPMRLQVLTTRNNQLYHQARRIPDHPVLSTRGHSTISLGA